MNTSSIPTPFQHFLTFLTIVVTILLAGAEVDLFIPSFPEMMKEFNLSPLTVQLTLSVNFVSYCISSLFVGSLGDRYGPRCIIVYSLVIFTLGSICCVCANSFLEIVLGRFLQGVGMAGPAVLGYVVMMNITPIEKQAGTLGILNGLITSAMAFAPVIGSYINIAFGWKGNFILLLVHGLLALVLSFLFIPKTDTFNPNVSLSLREYSPLLKSSLFLKSLFLICLLSACYWVFIGMGPILYMNDMGVDIRYFGFYQGALAGIFAITSFLSPIALKKYPSEKLFRFSMKFLMLMIVGTFLVSLYATDNPILITTLVGIYLIPFVLPMNILYPISLDLIPNSKGKAAAMVNFGRLLLSAIGLECVGMFYNGFFFPIAIFMLLFSGISFLISTKIENTSFETKN